YTKEQRGRFRDEAAGLLGVKASAAPPATELDLETALSAAGALLLAGDAPGYQRLCARLLEHADRLTCLNQPNRRTYLLTRTCLLAPGGTAAAALPVWIMGNGVTARGGELGQALADSQAPVRVIDRGVYAQVTDPAWHLHTYGLAHYRAG